MAFPLINPILQFMDNAGEPLSGGLLYTYAPGTTTNKTTYTDENLSVPNANPIVLDSAGRCTIFLTDGEEYKFVLQTSAAVTLRTIDEVKSPSGITQAAIALALFPRTTAESSAGITPSDYAYLAADALGGMFRYGAVGNYTGAGAGTDDSTAFRNACLVIQARGGGVLDLGSRRYRLYSDGSTATLGDFSNLRGITIKSDGAELAIDRTFTGSQTVTPFIFTACEGVHFVGHIKVTCTQTQPINEKTSRGVEFATFRQGCTNVTSEMATFNSLRVGFYPRREAGDPASYISRGFKLGVIHASQTGYPLTNAGATGHQMTASLVTTECGRSLFLQGMLDATVYVDSADAEASVDCLLTNVTTTGMDGVTVYYTNTRSTIADSSRSIGVDLQIQDSDLQDVRHSNVKVILNIRTGASTYTGPGFRSSKLKHDSTADAVDRGHILENIEVSGSIVAGNINQIGVQFCSVGTWGTGELVRNIAFTNLRMAGTGQPSFNLRSIQDKAVFTNVYSSANMNIVGNTTGEVILVGCESGGSFTVDTADTTRHIYYGCKIGSMTDQSTLNKAFHSCPGLPTGFTATLTGISGTDPTATIQTLWEGDTLRLVVPALQGTSDTTAATLTGMPASMYPTSTQTFGMRVIDNSAGQFGYGEVSTSGVITLRLGNGSATFTGSGTKGVSAYADSVFDRKIA